MSKVDKAPLPDLLPQPLKWPLFAHKRPLHGMVGPGGYKTSGRERRAAARAEAAEDGGACVQARLAKVENQLDRFRAEEFWDHVMQEIAEPLAERRPLTLAEILLELRAVNPIGRQLGAP